MCWYVDFSDVFFFLILVSFFWNTMQFYFFMPLETLFVLLSIHCSSVKLGNITLNQYHDQLSYLVLNKQCLILSPQNGYPLKSKVFVKYLFAKIKQLLRGYNLPVPDIHKHNSATLLDSRGAGAFIFRQAVAPTERSLLYVRDNAWQGVHVQKVTHSRALSRILQSKFKVLTSHNCVSLAMPKGLTNTWNNHDQPIRFLCNGDVHCSSKWDQP